MSEERRTADANVPDTTLRPARSILLKKWWGTFRLAVLLAIGPGLIVLAVATAGEVARPGMPTTNIPAQMKLTLGMRLYQAVLLVASFLAHGAAITSAGLVLSLWIKRRGRAIGLNVCLILVLAMAWPIFVILIRRSESAENLSALSPVSVASHVFENLMTRLDQFPTVALWGTFYDVVAILLAIGLFRLALRRFDANFEPDTPGFSLRKDQVERARPVVETVTAGE